MNLGLALAVRRVDPGRNEECPSTLRHLGYYEKNLSMCVMLDITCSLVDYS